MIDWDSLVIAPCVGAFGQAVTYQPMRQAYRGAALSADGAPAAITAVYDEAYRSLDPTGMAEMIGSPSNISSSHPVLGVRLATLPRAPRQGDRATIAATGRTFVVAEVRPDSHGHALLMLNEAT